MKDQATVDYFDSFTPEYSLARFQRTVQVINSAGGGPLELIDVGCGTGNVLAFLRGETSIGRLWGLDVSAQCLEKARQRVDCETLRGSILDDEFVGGVRERFDVAVLGAVLHHLIGRNRRESRAAAEHALRNTFSLVQKGGQLVLMEPTWAPRLAMDAVFWLKKAVTRVTSRRVGLFGFWNNIGAPIVSYYTNEELLEMIGRIPDAEVSETEFVPQRLNWLVRLAGIRRRDDATFVIRKRATA